MEADKEEALKAKEMAEKRFAEMDFLGAKSYANKAKTLNPDLEGISQMVATFEVYVASGGKCNGQVDCFAILGLNPSADKYTAKKKYKKMAAMLHPDENKCIGSDGAFKLVSEAWRRLQEKFDRRRKENRASSIAQKKPPTYAPVVSGVSSYPNPSYSHGRHDTFWTVCTSCKVQYEYLRKYVNKRLSCKNCRGTFIAVETGAAPLNGAFSYSSWSYPSHAYDGATSYTPTNGTYYMGNGVSTYHSGHGYEYDTNVPYEWSSHSSVSNRDLDSNRVSTTSTNYNGVISRANGTVSSVVAEPSGSKSGRPDKRRRVSTGSSFINGCDEKGSKSDSETKLIMNSNIGEDSKLPGVNEDPTRRCSAVPAYDGRKLLMDKARKQITNKLDAIRLATEAAAAAAALRENEKPLNDTKQSTEHKEVSKKGNVIISGRSISVNVPDPDFHDFDKDRSEDCFKPKQIWAIYDEDDGMPRLYCLIREVISTNPFKIHITYLNSKTDTEFGTVNWIDSGFTKSCGRFRAWNSDVIEQVNIFSHLLRGKKAGRGGCIKIFPKSGDVWAVYRNWSPEWDRSTPDDVRHQYEMVEVLGDYCEDIGVCVAPLVKLAGFQTVYQRDTNKDAIRWIPRREMVRFSHQVPSWSIKAEESNMPNNCWDLDPAATPDQLLNAGTEEGRLNI